MKKKNEKNVGIGIVKLIIREKLWKKLETIKLFRILEHLESDFIDFVEYNCLEIVNAQSIQWNEHNK